MLVFVAVIAGFHLCWGYLKETAGSYESISVATAEPVSSVAPDSLAYSISLSKSDYAPAEPIIVEISNVSPEMVGDGAIVGVCSADAGPGEYISYEYLDMKDESVKLRAPLSPGVYSIRGYTSNSTMGDSFSFAVNGDSSGAYSISLDKPSYSPGENINVYVRGAPRYMVDDGAVVGVYRLDAGPDDFITRVNIYKGDDEVLIFAPSVGGLYEVRGYSNDSILTDSTVVAKTSFSVAE
jgi:hypothetical protein